MPERILNAAEALACLRDGNARYVSEDRSPRSFPNYTPSPELASEPQRPIAIVLGCSDSRVPIEIVFDQGPGDLFVIRVAGNVVGPSAMGSVEFAASRFGTSLVVVLGHSGCGAVLTTFDVLEGKGAAETYGLRAIVERISPVVEPLRRGWPPRERSELVGEAVRANVRAGALQLRHGSTILEPLVASGKLSIVGAEYALESGQVDFFDLPPELER